MEGWRRKNSVTPSGEIPILGLIREFLGAVILSEMAMLRQLTTRGSYLFRYPSLSIFAATAETELVPV
jgi:hypothetical protein